MISAADRKVIREALEKISAIYHPTCVAGSNARLVLALLDKPQPESAGDARELAVRMAGFLGHEIHATPLHKDTLDLIEALQPEFEAFASLIRAETLENLRKQLNHERHEFNRIAMQGPHKKSKDFIAGWFDANFNAKMQISYALTKPTGTP